MDQSKVVIFFFEIQSAMKILKQNRSLKFTAGIQRGHAFNRFRSKWMLTLGKFASDRPFVLHHCFRDALSPMTSTKMTRPTCIYPRKHAHVHQSDCNESVTPENVWEKKTKN